MTEWGKIVAVIAAFVVFLIFTMKADEWSDLDDEERRRKMEIEDRDKDDLD